MEDLVYLVCKETMEHLEEEEHLDLKEVMEPLEIMELKETQDSRGCQVGYHFYDFIFTRRS